MTQELPVRSDADAQRHALAAVLQRSELTLEQVWLRYFSLGGEAALIELEGYLHDVLSLPDLQRDILAHAVNEQLDELAGALRVPYSRPLRAPRPVEGPLAAMVTLLELAPQAVGGALPTVATTAGQVLGVRLTLHLVDYEQRHLVPLLTPGDDRREPVPVDGTLPGRAFQLMETQSSVLGAEPRWWVPLLDGAERLGVVEVVLASDGDASDPVLREQCEWLARMLGHLVTGASDHGDSIEAVRRSRERAPAAELVWQQLPPLTAARESFVLSGLLEPAYEVGGDAFDYALSEERVDLAIFDAMGHALGAGLIATAALAAYRSARRAGRDLHGQAAAIDAALAEHFPDALATGVLATLDLRSGRLSYLAAGHPAPLVLRGGQVVISLDDGRRTPFGLDTGERVLGEASLQPGDCLALYTDGVVEARDPQGEQFGERRLVDFLEREAASGHPPPETVRRLVHAVLAHQDGVLQDDATVLLAQWAGDGRLAPDVRVR